jgi:hypothetical protein
LSLAITSLECIGLITGHCIDCLFENKSIIKLDIFCDVNFISHENFIIIKFLTHCNMPWTSERHYNQSNSFKKAIYTFLFCLQQKQKQSKLKIPKLVLFEIIKAVNRKAFLHHEFPRYIKELEKLKETK